ncbi:MAG: DUF1080 domain-containing protein [Pirellulaceae bacterium]
MKTRTLFGSGSRETSGFHQRIGSGIRERSDSRSAVGSLTTSAALLLVSALCLHSQAAPPEAKPQAESEASPPRVVNLFNGKDLKGWRVVEKVDFEKHGKVEVKDGVLHLNEGRTATGVSYTGKLPRDNYEISLEAKRTTGSDFFCGLTFPVDDEYCTFIVGGWGGGVTGLSNIDGLSAEENETTGYTEFKKDQWYKIRLRVTDAAIQGWIDKEQVFDVKRTDRKFAIWWEQEPVRPLGVAAWRTGSALRNIRLTRLDLPAEK